MEELPGFSCDAEKQSCTVRAFWLGKELLASQNAAIREELSALTRTQETALSGHVYQLVCGPQHSLEENERKNIIKSELLNDEGTIIWEFFDLILQEKVGSGDDNGCKLEEVIWQLFPVCRVVHHIIINQLTHQEFKEKYEAKLEWTGCKGRLLECHNLLKSEDPTDVILSILLLTSSLEHALGDVYMSYSQTSQCPYLLRDLLATEELESLLGAPAMSLLHVLIGPPSGLNLRNVLWHGFAAPGEVPFQYGSMLLLLLASFSDKLSTESFCSRNIQRRPLLNTFSHFKDLGGIFPEIKSENFGEIKRLLSESFFVIPSMLPVWLRAVGYFGKGRYDFGVVLLLPLLEHGLRRVFASVNRCPERFLTAESTALYTTFDEILALNLPDGTKNALREEVGDSFFEMLQDLLVHPEGPRLRDHISHGEVDISLLPRELANHILCVCVAFASLYKIPEESHSGLGRNDVALIEQISQASRTYRSVFHPISILKRKTRIFLNSLSSCRDLPKPDINGFEYFTSFPTEPSSFLEQEKALKSVSASIHEQLSASKVESVLCTQQDFMGSLSALLDKPVALLFRPKSELEIVSLFRSIVQHCQMIVDQVCEAAKVRYEQWQRKELRSRQRANYMRLWTHMSKLLGSLQVIVTVVIAELMQLPDSDKNRTAYIKFLKRCLQCTENLETLSNAAKNRWDECCTVAVAMVEAVEQYYTARRVHVETSYEGHDCTEQLVSLFDVQQHANREDAWIIIDGKVYDVTSYVNAHPGGDAILNNVGGDASEGFHDQKAHGVVKNHIARLLEDYRVGLVAENEGRFREITEQESTAKKSTELSL